MMEPNGACTSPRSSVHPRQQSIEDDEVAETDPEGRYYRYRDVVGKGRFKQIFKAFDSQLGIDVAWSKIASSVDSFSLSSAQLQDVVTDMSKGLDLEHGNIIRCYKCWLDGERRCINLITELFTSGNLRQYRNLHKHLDLKAVKRMARQILKGLEYLHSMGSGPIAHGDLRCDKIYVNGHSGEIKIGDLGLATLLPFRWEDGAPPADTSLVMSPEADVFAFGLCVLELLTLRQLDQQHFDDLAAILADIADDDACLFVSKCLGPRDERPSALQLLDDPFLNLKKVAASVDGGGGGALTTNNSTDQLMLSLKGSLRGALHSALSDLGEGGGDGGGRGGGGGHHYDHHERSGDGGGGNGGYSSRGGEQDYGESPSTSVAVGKLKGEDYNFELQGRVKDGKLSFRLLMSLMPREAAINGQEEAPCVRTIDFTFDPDEDTPDKVAVEIGNEFDLSSTDQEICASALREWLARESMWVENNQ